VGKKLETKGNTAMPQLDASVHSLPAPPPSPTLLAAVSRTTPVTTRRPGRTFAGIALISIACVVSLLVWSLGLRRDLGSIPLIPVFLYGAACLASFGAHLATAVLPSAGEVLPAAHRSVRLSFFLATITVPLGILLGVRAHPGTHPTVGQLAGFWTHALPCLLNGFTIAAVPALLAIIALRRVIPRGSWRVALPVGGAAGVLAGLALELHCPRFDLVHVGLAHGSVMVIPALLLAILGIRLLSD
jgi:negative regulator of sigma F NrsF-like protein